MHQHQYVEHGNFNVCSECGARKMILKQVSEDILIGRRSDGKKYIVRKHRKSYFMPDTWRDLITNLPSYRSKLTAHVLLQTGARINEATHIEERDIDYSRNILKLRVTKTKARKAGEERGVPRTIPISSQFAAFLKKHFQTHAKGSSIGLLTDQAFNITMKSTLKRMGIPDYRMFSAHSIRKTHGNWLKIMGNAGMMKVDMSEICLRLGHDMNTFLKDYGSSGVMNNADLVLIKKILGDLYG